MTTYATCYFWIAETISANDHRIGFHLVDNSLPVNFQGPAVDLDQVYGYKNLFVVDGALLPGSAATVNPAFTIAANAERIMETLVRTL